ncbi:MAG: hypothetical protein IJV89_04020 [Lentisphaeria bacterium]|nr:hypothetical protein [Lentisphaeria bacterium]
MRKLRIRTVYGAVFAAALLFRVGVLCEFFHSPLAHYWRIPGLDMKTHLELGAMFAGGEGVFALYRLITAWVPHPAGLVFLQSLAGCLIALLTALITLRLFGRKGAALLAGLLAAWYGNAVLYELVTLPETLNILTVLAGFAAVLQAKRKKFAGVWSLCAGILLALSATGRPVNVIAVLAILLWAGCQLYRKKARKGAAALLAGLCLVWVPVTAWNALHGWPLPVYGSNFQYAAQVAEKTDLASWNVGEKKEAVSVLRIAGSFPVKLLKVFSIREIPDNLNYYFLKNRFIFMRFAVPAALLISLGTAGMITLLCRKNRRGIMLMLWLLALSLIFAAYYPAGRYRLILYPYFAVFAAIFFTELLRPGRALPILAGILTLSCQWMITPHPAILRAADHTAWGMALIFANAPEEAADREFMEAVRLSGGAPRETARVLHRLMLKNRPAEARKLLREYPGNDPYRIFYDALLDFGDGSILEARRKLEALQNSVPPEVRPQYFYFLGEACFRTGAGAEAVDAYRELLKMTRTDEQKRVIQEKIRKAQTLPPR